MSDLPWLRLYTDTIDNEKLRLLAFEDRWHFIAILCLKQQGVINKNDPLLDRKISVKMGVQVRELEEIKRRLSEVNLIDDNYNPIGWDKHQFISDSSTNRVRKYRENKKKKECNVTETLQKRKCNAIETDTEQIQIKKKKKETFHVPSWLDENIWLAFVEHRQKLKSPMTDRAKTLIINKLEKQKEKANEIISQSIENGWKGIFDLKEEQKPKFNNQINTGVMITGKQKNILPKPGESMQAYEQRVRQAR